MRKYCWGMRKRSTCSPRFLGFVWRVSVFRRSIVVHRRRHSSAIMVMDCRHHVVEFLLARASQQRMHSEVCHLVGCQIVSDEALPQTGSTEYAR